MREPTYFARFISDCMTQVDRIAVYEQNPNMPAQLIWPEIADADWREGAINAINKDELEQAQFIEPDPEHEWVFVAVRRGRQRYQLN